MLLIIGIMIATGTAEMAPLDGTFAFSEQGSVAHTVSNAHLVIPVDFKNLHDKIASFCDQVSDYVEKIQKRPDPFAFNYPDVRTAEVSVLRCRSLLSEFQAVKEIWYPQPLTTSRKSSLTRRKRGGGWAVVGVGAVAAVAMFSQIYSHTQLSSLVEQTQKQTESHILRLREAISLNDDNIKQLNDSVYALSNETSKEIIKLKDAQALTALYSTLSTLESTTSRILTGLVKLSQHRLSPMLISPHSLTSPLSELQDALKPQQIFLSVANAYETYQLDVSHVMLKNLTLLIYIHIPCFSPQHKLKLYGYRQLPIELPTPSKPIFILPTVADQFLAISQSELEYQTFTKQHLLSCPLINDIYFCPGPAVLRRTSADSCLYAIFKLDYHSIRTNCRWSIANVTSIVPINNTHFIVFSPPPSLSMLRVHCPPSTINQVPLTHVLSIVTLQPGCRALSDMFVFTAPFDLPVFRPLLSSGALTYQPLLPPNVLLSSSLNDSLEQFAATLPQIQSPFSLLDPSLFSYSSSFSPLSLSALLPLALISVLLFVFIRRLLSSPRHSTALDSATQHGDTHIYTHETSHALPHSTLLNTSSNPFFPTPFSGLAPIGPLYEVPSSSPPHRRQPRFDDVSPPSRPLPPLPPHLYPPLPRSSSPTTPTPAPRVPCTDQEIIPPAP